MIEPPSTGFLVSQTDREVLLRWSRSRTLAARVVLRSRIVLLLSAGKAVSRVAGELRVAPATVRLWKGRFIEHGPQGLLNEAPGRGRKPALDFTARQALRSMTAEGHVLSVRRQAGEMGVSASTVSRWRRRRE